MNKASYGNLPIRLIALVCAVVVGLSGVEQTKGGGAANFAQMQSVVAKASERLLKWDGPTVGPKGMSGMTVAVVCEDLRNGGVLGVAQGINEAALELGWRIKMLDAKGSVEGRYDALEKALSMKPNGLILLGSDANSLERILVKFKKQNIPIVGWHTGKTAGKLSVGSVAVNISTDPLQVARITAMKAVLESNGQTGVVIFTDSNFEIAMNKANEMARIIKECSKCTLLEIKRVPISQSAQVMPQVTKELSAKYGKRWTHALAINDIYFDYATPELTRSKQNIRLFSAGDGSPAAFMRIQAGAYQYGTVAEPLNLQGWQLLDELNRLLSGQSVSGYIAPVHLVTPQNIAYDGGPQLRLDPDNGYRKIYQKIWKHR